MSNNYNYIPVKNIIKVIFLAFIVVLPSLLFAQQSPSIQTGVTFQWSDTQSNTTDPATIASVTINGVVYNTFVVPTAYEMTRLGPDGHGQNSILENGTTLANSSNLANWNSIALAAFQDKNNNHYFESNLNGRNICNNFAAIASTDAQKQSIFYNPAIPSNEGGVLAVTERNVNNCYHIAIYGAPPAGGPDQFLGETFVRPTSTQWGPKFPPNQQPNTNSDYWKTERVVENNGTIGIALFYLSDIVPTGSKIKRIEFNASTVDHGDGKIYLLQKYAVDQENIECINGTYNGNLNETNNVPANSTYSLISGPTPAGQSFNFNADGTYTFVPTEDFTGDITFEYEVCLPAPNTTVCDQAAVTLTYAPLPPEPDFKIGCETTTDDFNITVTSPLGAAYEYSIDNGNTFQTTPDFNGLSEGNYNLVISNTFTECIKYSISNPIVLTNLDLSATVTDVLCRTDATGAINITVTGGTAPYTYFWNNSMTSEDLNNVIAGNYTVTITDVNGCTIIEDYTINQPSQELSSSRTIDDVLCNGDNTGAIYLSVNGGTPPYTYLWSNGSTDQNITGLTAGNYSVTITDASGCTATNSATVTEPDAIPCQIIVDGCPPAVDTACSTDGVGTSFSWLPPQYSFQCCTSSPGDDYSFNVEFDLPESGNECWEYNRVQRIGNNNLRLFQSSGTDVNFTTPLSYFDTSSGLIINMELIVPSVTFDWTLEVLDNSTVIFSDTVNGISSNGLQTITIPSSVPSGSYKLRFSFDDNGSNLNASDHIEVDRIYYNAVLIDATCLDGINFAVTSNYNPGDLFPDGTTGVSYTATYTYPDGSTDVLTCSFDVTITNIELAEVTAVKQDVACNGESDGAFTINATGGTEPYTYSLDNIDFSNTTGVFNNLSAGNYIVYVKDDNNCLNTINITISEPDELELAITSVGDVLCSGESTGEVTVEGAGGIPPYSYSIDNGNSYSTDTTFTSLAEGNYTVIVLDANGCTFNQAIAITEPSNPLMATITTVTDVLCNSESTGGIDITVTGGTAPYTYVWNDTNNSATEDLSNFIAGAYNVTVTDANGCTTSIGATISEPTTALSLNITKIDATTAQGCANGQATAIVSGGTPNYTYQWGASAGNQTTATATGLSDGTHSVTVTDNNGCQLTQSIIIECVNTCDAEIAITNITDVLCTGDASGSGTVTANSDANPTATFTFTWSNGQVDAGVTTSTLGNLVAGVYTVSVTIDGTVCQAVEDTIAITEPSNALDVTATTTDELGPTTGDGTATAVITGGVEPYTYSWSPGGQNTAVITGLSAGSYTVTVTDANGCTDATSVTVNPGSCQYLSVTGTSTPAVCFGESNGSVTATVTGGSGNFTYAWDTIPNTTTVVSNLPAGDYTITVTDTTTLCTTSTTIAINEPNVLSSAIAVTNILCRGDATGSLDLAVNGGTAPYAFIWSNGSTNEDLINVVAGTYSVTITDANGCTTTNSDTIVEPDTNVSASITSQTNVDCFGNNTGEVTIEGAGGIPPYSYSIDNGTSYSTDTTFISLAEGNYTVIVLDANGCTFNQAIAITEPSNPLTATITTVTDVLCNSESTGGIDITVTGGTAPYTYVWNDTNNSATEDLSNVIAGAYNVTVTDANGCTTSIGATISEPTTALSLNITKIDATTAQGCANGQATAIVSGGTLNYTYQWGASAGNQTTATATELSDGTHSVTVTDNNGCQLTQSIIIECVNTCDAEIAITNITDVLCTGDASGSGTVTANSDANPTATFTFTWSNGQVDAGVTTSTLGNLVAGVYTVSVTIDGTVCQAVEDTIAITEPSNALDVTATTTDELGPTTGDGTATAVITGGVEPYTYSWSPGGQNTDAITGLSAGSYTVTVTDANGCTDATSVTVNPGSCQNLSVTGTSTPAVCFGESNGSVTATVTGGSGNFTYAWDTIPNTTTVVSNLPAGDYTITVTDTTTLCTTSTTIAINEPNVLSSAIAVTNILCRGDATGSLDLAVNGGTAPYAFIWSNGSTNEDLINVVAGTYSVTITDANGCTTTNSDTIVEPDTNVSASITNQTNVDCFGNNTGEVTIEGAGGIPPYSYSIDNGNSYSTDTTFTSLAEGNYTVIVLDANGCTFNQAIAITEPSNPLTATITTVTDVLCNSESTGGIDITVTGGTAPYTYVWNDTNNSATEDLSNFIAGAYNVTVTDANGCTTSIGATISEPTTALSLNITKIDATTAQGCANGQATAIVSGGTPNYTYQWGASAGNQTTATATELSDGTHSVTVTDNNGCQLTQSIIIECVNTCDAEIAITNITDVLCTGDASGSGTVTANSDANPTATFTFTWSNGQVDAGVTTSTLASLVAGVYTVSVTIDGTVCQAVEDTIAITEPSNALDVTATTTDELGPTTGDGTATAVITGGVEPYTYSWSPGGQNTDAITGLSAGSYTVTVTDANGCTDATSVTVNPGSCQNLSVTGTSTPAVCFGESNGSVTATVTGGSGNFTYAWDTIPNTTTSVSNLPAGDYTITVTDTTTLCTTSTTIAINEPNILSSAIAVTNILCKGDATGSLDLAVNGGTAPYAFIWSNGSTNEDLINVVAGTYSVTITDANGCTTTNSDTIVEPDTNVSASITNQTDIVCEGLGSINVEGAGGIPPYSYTIDGGTTYQISGTFTDLTPGNYTITVLDANGCTIPVTTDILINCTDAIADINNTFVDQPVSGNVLTNDEDFEGDNQTVTTNTNPANGSVIVNPDGTYTYTPNTGFIGEDTFTYTICDDGNPQACDTASVYIEVIPMSGPENEAPIANADTATTPIGTPVDIVVLANDFDPDADPITITGNTDPTNGSVTVNPDGTITYTPDTGFTGEDTFTYTICDDGNPQACDTATVTVTVQLANTPNTTNANDDAYTTTPDTTVTGNVLANDNDVEGDTQTVTTTTVTTAEGIAVSIDPNTGIFTYTPPAGFSGLDSFVYTICDDGTPQACDQATVYIIVGGIANTTDAIADINNTFADQPVSGNVLTNDEDFEGDNQTVTANTNPANGSVVVNPDGTYTYTPNTGFTGEDIFTYTICDDGNPQACDTASVYIEVLPMSGPENEAPIANADTATTPIGTPVDIVVLANDFDPDADPITITGNTDPTNGSVTVNPDGTITYTPDTGFTGEDTFTYTICDDENPALCDTATVTVTVQPANTPNTTNANDDAYTTTPDTTVTGNVLANDNDVEGDTQTVTTTTVTTAEGVTLSIDPNTGIFTYTPPAGFSGLDSFVYTICDDGTPQACDQATVYFIVGGIANTTDAIADINNTFVDQPVSGNVLTNDEDFEGDNQTVTANTNPANGSVVVNPDGTYTYTPNTGFTGEDIFTYTICDDGNPQACDTASVYIEVIPMSGPENEAPIANADTATTPIGTPVDIVVLANDFDPDADPITITGNTDPTNGSVTVNPDGTITYTPDTGFTGEDTFTYTICDDGNPQACDTATVTVTVQPANTPNTTNANDDAYTTTPDTTVTGNVLANDNDVEGDTQTVTTTTVTTAEGVTLSIDPNTGIFTYTPPAGFSGLDSFVYTICDDGTPQACDQATVYIIVGGIANTTDAIADINNTFADQPVSGNVLTNDEDFEGDNQTVTANTNPANGSVIVNPDGTYTYTPNTGFTGEDTFTYTICDDGNPQACDTASVYIEVIPMSGPENEAPIANADTATTPIGTPVDIVVLANDFDPDADPITITGNTDPTNGSVTVNPDGTITYTPDTGFTGEDTFTYTICDDGNPQACDTATVTVTVQPANTPNTTNANDDAFNATPTSVLTGNVLLNDNDIEGDSQTITTTTVTTAEGITVSIDPNTGIFTYIPNPGFSGTDSFVYTVCDDNTPQACDQATVYITIDGVAMLNIVKSAANANGNPCVSAGDSVTYTFTVTNPGDLLINTITITDDLLGGDITNTLTLSGDTNNDGILHPSETWVFTALDYLVTQANVDAGNITNNVIADGLEPDGTSTIQATDTYIIDANNTDVTLCNDSDINIVKSGVFNNENTNNCTEIDETITYIFTVTNTADISLANVIIADPLLDNALPSVTINFVSGDTDTDNEIDPTETWIYNASYLVTQIDIDAKEVNNTATVTAEEVVNNGIVTDTDQTTTDLIEDTIPPNILNCAAPVSVNVDASGCTTDIANVNLGTPTVDDNCTATAVTNDAPSVFPLGDTTVTWTVTDASGNSATCTQTVTIIDNIDPTFVSCAAPVSVNVDASGCTTDIVNVNLGTPTVDDNCTITTVANDAPAFFPLGDTIVIWTVTDGSGNTATCEQTVTITDNIDPTITCAVPVSVNVDASSCTIDAANVDLGTLTTSDNCTVVIVTNDAPAVFPLGDTTVTWTVTDGSGNTATCTQLVTITDNIDPTFVTCAAPVAATVDSNSCTAEATNVNLGTPTTDDNCTIANVTNNAPAFFPLGDTIVTWTVTDGSGNTATCEQLVTITDDIDPTITCALPVSVNLDASSCTLDASNVDLGTLTTSDNCTVVIVTNDAPSVFPLGDTIVTWTVTDGSGNTATCTQTVTIIDNIDPTFVSCAAPVSVNVDASGCTADIANVNLGTPTVDDNCTTTTITNDAPNVFPLGDTTVTWTVTDGSGNTATCTQTVTIIDNIDPTFVSCAAPVSVNVDASGCTTDIANVNLGTPTVDDNCTTTTITNDAPNVFLLGDTTVTWTVTDGSGNTATCTQTVTIIDNIDPTFVSCAAPVSVNVDASGCTTDIANVNLGTPTVDDNCTTTTITNDAPTVFPLGDTTVTWTVTDGAGNTATCTQLVTVIDNIDPTFVTCAAPVSVNIDASGCTADIANVNLGTPTVDDNCTTTTITNDAPSVFPLGDTTVTWTVTDGSGNTATCTQTVTIIDNIDPTFVSCAAPASVNVDASGCTTDIANVNLGTPTVDDNCTTTTITNDAPNVFPLGDTTVTWTVTDGSGNTATCTQTVTIIDNIDPTFVSCAAPVSVNVDASGCTTDATNVNLGTPTVDDNCTTTTITNDAPTSFPLGDTTVTWTVTDGAGNTTTCTQLVTVIDNIDPVFVQTLPSDETYECDSVPEAEILTATDPCGDVDVVFTETRIDGSCVSNYSLERKWVATDQNGLSITHIQTITVQDTTAPEPTATIAATIAVNCESIPDVPTIEFTDNCSTNVDVVFEEINSFDENNPSDYDVIRTWTVTDECSNSEVFTQTISVTLNNFINTINERACSDDGTINLDDYLVNNQTGGTWIVVEGGARLNGSIFDPENVVLGNYTFSYTIASNGCLDTTEVNLEIHDECIVLPCGREDVIISKVVTPNGDAYNEFLTITGVETCGFIVELKIFNRWGAKIYDNSNYQNDWNGFAHNSSVGRADKVPNGTYFYIINLKNSGLEPFAKAFYVGTK